MKTIKYDAFSTQYPIVPEGYEYNKGGTFIILKDFDMSTTSIYTACRESGNVKMLSTHTAQNFLLHRRRSSPLLYNVAGTNPFLWTYMKIRIYFVYNIKYVYAYKDIHWKYLVWCVQCSAHRLPPSIDTLVWSLSLMTSLGAQYTKTYFSK